MCLAPLKPSIRSRQKDGSRQRKEGFWKKNGRFLFVFFVCYVFFYVFLVVFYGFSRVFLGFPLFFFLGRGFLPVRYALEVFAVAGAIEARNLAFPTNYGALDWASFFFLHVFLVFLLC